MVWPAFVNRLFQGIQDEAGMGCPADPPAHDIAGVDVDHEGHVDEAGPGRDVSEVRRPTACSAPARGTDGSPGRVGTAPPCR